MSRDLDAVAYASQGWWVFPVSGKRPLTRRGFLDAVTSPDEARELFAQHPQATGVAVATGLSGLLVIDLDGDEGKLAWTRIAGRHDGHDPTRLAVTGTGGLHVWFSTRDPRARSTAGRLAPHVDTRGVGGYVLAPPSRHPNGNPYRWRDPGAPLADAPEWLLCLLASSKIPPAVGVPRDLPNGVEATAYGRAALQGLCANMLAAVEGVRNTTLVGVSYRAGRLSAAGEIEHDAAHDVLVEAAQRVGLGAVEAARTFASGFSAGRRIPAIKGAPW